MLSFRIKNNAFVHDTCVSNCYCLYEYVGVCVCFPSVFKFLIPLRQCDNCIITLLFINYNYSPLTNYSFYFRLLVGRLLFELLPLLPPPPPPPPLLHKVAAVVCSEVVVLPAFVVLLTTFVVSTVLLLLTFLVIDAILFASVVPSCAAMYVYVYLLRHAQKYNLDFVVILLLFELVDFEAFGVAGVAAVAAVVAVAAAAVEVTPPAFFVGVGTISVAAPSVTALRLFARSPRLLAIGVD